MSMRKVLLGTTALVAAGLLLSSVSYAQDEEMAADEMMADEAMAEEMMAEPLSASVSGHYYVALGLLSGDDGAGEPLQNKHGTAMAQDLQLVFSGSTTLDNGMTVSLRAVMDSDHNDLGNAHWDERSITIGGAFGRLQLGSVESARQQTTTFAPSATSSMGINTPYFHFANSRNFEGLIGRYNDGIGAEDSLKIIYFTPTMNGFNIGVSYAPEDGGGSQYGKDRSDDADAYQNHIGVGATFSQDFAGGSIVVSAGYETYEAEVPAGMSCSTSSGGKPIVSNCDPETVQFGLSLSFGDFSFGGGWQESDASETTKSSVMDFGISYSSGPMSLAAMYGQANTEATNGDAETARYGVNGSYALGAGVAVEAQLDFGEYDAAGPKDPTSDYDWVQFMIGTAVSF